jgi:hypothetical protein
MRNIINGLLNVSAISVFKKSEAPFNLHTVTVYHNVAFNEFENYSQNCTNFEYLHININEHYDRPQLFLTCLSVVYLMMLSVAQTTYNTEIFILYILKIIII